MTWLNGARVRSSRSLRDPLELGARQRLVQEQRVLVRVDRDVRQVDRGRVLARQLDLGLLRGLTQPLHRHLVLGQVDAVAAAELVDEPADDPLVPVVATEVVVAVGRLDLDDALTDLQQRDVEGAATEVEDQDGLLLLALVQAVGQGRGGGLVDDAQDLQARDLAGLLGGLALCVLEVRGDGDDGLGDRLTEVGLRVALELLQHARADLLGGVLLAVDVRRGPTGADVALDRTQRPVDVGHRLVLGGLTDQHLAVARERHDRGCGPRTLRVRDDRRLAALEDGDDGVGGPEVDADRTSHVLSSVILQWGCSGRGVLSLSDSSSSGTGADRQTEPEPIRSTCYILANVRPPPDVPASGPDVRPFAGHRRRRRDTYPGRHRVDESSRRDHRIVRRTGRIHPSVRWLRRPECRSGL